MNTNTSKKNLSAEQIKELINVLRARFQKNMQRHKGLEWAPVQAKLVVLLVNGGRCMKWKAPVYSWVTTGRNRTMLPADFVARSALNQIRKQLT